MLFALDRFSRKQFFKEAYLIIALALPMLVAQVAQVSMGFVDTAMSGRVSAQDLAAVGLGTSIFVTIYITLMGMPTALNPILSQLFGAKALDKLAKEACQGVALSFVLGLIGMLLIWALIFPVLSALHLQPYTEDTVALYLVGVSWGLPAALAQRALLAYIAALNRTQAAMWVGVGGLLLNIPLNYILINGLYGMPKLGGAGCGFATAAVYWVGTIGLWFYVRKSRHFAQARVSRGLLGLRWSMVKPMLRLGFPISLSFFLEVSLFSFVALLIANFGEHYVAAQQVVLVISSIIYMLPQTLGAATSVRVGQALGSAQRVRAYYVSGVGMALGAVGAILSALLVFFNRERILYLFTQDLQVIALGLNLLLFMMAFQFFDATQTIASAALRGYKITKVPMVIHAVAFWVFGLGLGYVLAFFVGWGLYGFWSALVVSLFIASLALTAYLVVVGREMIQSFA